MRSIILALLACSATGLGTMYLAKVACDLPEPATFEIVAETYSGNVYVAGVGDSCRAAWEGARVPSDWSSIICRESK